MPSALNPGVTSTPGPHGCPRGSASPFVVPDDCSRGGGTRDPSHSNMSGTNETLVQERPSGASARVTREMPRALLRGQILRLPLCLGALGKQSIESNLERKDMREGLWVGHIVTGEGLGGEGQWQLCDNCAGSDLPFWYRSLPFPGLPSQQCSPQGLQL